MATTTWVFFFSFICIVVEGIPTSFLDMNIPFLGNIPGTPEWNKKAPQSQTMDWNKNIKPTVPFGWNSDFPAPGVTNWKPEWINPMQSIFTPNQKPWDYGFQKPSMDTFDNKNPINLGVRTSSFEENMPNNHHHQGDSKIVEADVTTIDPIRSDYHQSNNIEVSIINSDSDEHENLVLTDMENSNKMKDRSGAAENKTQSVQLEHDDKLKTNVDMETNLKDVLKAEESIIEKLDIPPDNQIQKDQKNVDNKKVQDLDSIIFPDSEIDTTNDTKTDKKESKIDKASLENAKTVESDINGRNDTNATLSPLSDRFGYVLISGIPVTTLDTTIVTQDTAIPIINEPAVAVPLPVSSIPSISTTDNTQGILYTNQPNDQVVVVPSTVQQTVPENLAVTPNSESNPTVQQQSNQVVVVPSVNQQTLLDNVATVPNAASNPTPQVLTPQQNVVYSNPSSNQVVFVPSNISPAPQQYVLVNNAPNNINPVLTSNANNIANPPQQTNMLSNVNAIPVLNNNVQNTIQPMQYYLIVTPNSNSQQLVSLSNVQNNANSGQTYFAVVNIPATVNNGVRQSNGIQVANVATLGNGITVGNTVQNVATNTQPIVYYLLGTSANPANTVSNNNQFVLLNQAQTVPGNNVAASVTSVPAPGVVSPVASTSPSASAPIITQVPNSGVLNGIQNGISSTPIQILTLAG